MHSSLLKSSLFAVLSLFSGVQVALLASEGDVAQRSAKPTIQIEFNKDIRPILADKCYACHGPDQSQRPTDLRFDTQEGAMLDLGGYSAITPGKPKESELVARIKSEGDDVMPPAEHPKKLSPAEIEKLILWIEQGANWQAHWAYESPKNPSIPEVENLSWGENFVDAFVLAELASRNIEPSPVADRRTLIRRLSFDLIGLPPTPAEVESYVADTSPNATEKVIDRLLRSPHFGERLAMYWLDLVRYADTVGYHGDQDMSVSPYRDYVIDAFNQNKPFDQFTREQLAGDLLDSPTQEQLIASGYNKLGMMSAEGGVQPEEYLTKYAADRVRTASTVWLGSTLGCAECHDHKFDPFTSKDFYRFAAFFADIKERGLYSNGNWGPMIDVADEALPSLLQPLDVRLENLEKRLQESTPEFLAEKVDWEQSLRDEFASWQILRPSELKAQGKTKLEVLEDDSVLASGPSPNTNSYSLHAAVSLDQVATLRIEVLPHESLPKNGPGRAGNGNFVITEVRAFAVTSEGEKPIEFSKAVATIEQADGPQNPYKKWAAAATIDLDAKGEKWGWAILPDAGKANALIVQLKSPISVDKLRIEIDQKHDNPKHTLGRFRVSASANHTGEEVVAHNLPANLRETVLVAPEERDPKLEQELTKYFRTVAKLLAPIRDEIAGVTAERKKLVERNTRTTLVTEKVEPREMRVLARGNWMDKSGEVVQPGVPHFLSQLETEERANRLDLANWLVSPENPLTARVFVNRLWKLYFGTGLSKVLDDLGSQGEPPSHPELLDALALEFINSGWDIKHMIKTLVMSQTYQQSSLPRPELQTVDAYNRLLARQARFRLDAELIRDNALALSGLLVKKVGGRSVKPYQPPGLYRHLNFPKRTYKQDEGDNQYRRGLYTHWQRQFLHPAMLAFDAPAREECTAERPRSNTPLAALVLLNDPSYVEAARVFAERAMLQDDNDAVEEAVNWMMHEALGRNPSQDEVRVLAELFSSQLEEFNVDPKRAEQLLNIGLSSPAEGLEPATLAAWTMVVRGILNLHETVTRN